jgi:Glycosyl transferases group 1
MRPRLREVAKGHPTFAGRIGAFVDFRQNGAHTLLPVDQRAEWAFFTNGDDVEVQKLWAREQGLPDRTSMGDILKAQIEHHRADVFYNMDTTGWKSEVIRSLPSCVRAVIGWQALPSRDVVLSDYDLVVNNFPNIATTIAKQGVRVDYFFPAYDPEMAPYAASEDRPVDVLFVGGYTRHHSQRAAILETVSKLGRRYNVAFHLDRSRLCALAESPIGRMLPLAKHRRPPDVMAVARDPVFGRDYYAALSTAKIVFNGAIDTTGPDRGNMRCFETMGVGAMLLSDEGGYPEGMTDGETLAIYKSADHAVELIEAFLKNPAQRLGLARRGHDMVSTRYSKQAQWARFEQLAASI